MKNEDLLSKVYEAFGDVEMDRATYVTHKSMNVPKADHIVKRFHTWTNFCKHYLMYCKDKKQSDKPINTKQTKPVKEESYAKKDISS